MAGRAARRKTSPGASRCTGERSGWRKPPTTRLPIARRARHGSGGRIPRVEDAALLTGRGRFIDDLGGRRRHAARRDPALTARARRNRRDRRHGGATRARRRGGPHRRGREGADREPRRRRQGADRMLADRGRARALCRRARRRRRRNRPLSGRRRARPDRGTTTSRCRRWSIRWQRWSRARRCSMTGFPATSPATGRFATAIRERHLPRRRTGSVSISAIRAIPARRSRPMASSPSTTPARMPTKCWRISKVRSACTP